MHWTEAMKVNQKNERNENGVFWPSLAAEVNSDFGLYHASVK